MQSVSMRDMLDAGVHFGHRTRYWSPKMAPYIFGTHENTHIINLEESLPLFNEAMAFAESLAANGKTILFVGTKRQARSVVARTATDCGMPYVNHRWLGGMLTNFRTIKGSVRRLLTLEDMVENGGGEGLTKKEQLSLDREREKLDRSLGGIKEMKGLPDALFVIDVGHESIAVKEARLLGIPVIGVVDTNTSPDDIEYVIPGNDDSIKSINLYLETLSETIRSARKMDLNEIISDDEFVEVTSDE